MHTDRHLGLDREKRGQITVTRGQQGYIAPVSYTHLDVYKRQGQNNPEDVISAGGIVIDKAAHLATVDGKPMELSFKAVSYTHLDVYKRQGLIRSVLPLL